MSQYPDIAGGGRVDGDFLSAMLDNYVIKSSTSTPRTAAALVADPDLTFPVVANALYDVELTVRFGALQAAGIQTTWTVPSGASGDRLCMGPGTANATQTLANTTEMKWITYPPALAVAYTDPRNVIADQTWFREHSLLAIGSTAGSVTLNWGQATANATGTVVYLSSAFRYRRIG
jgi:hypothetical protein